MSQPIKNQSRRFDEYECGNGPRPPVPGEESQVSKMTSEGACGSTSNINQSPETEISFANRVLKWQDDLPSLLADQEGSNLLFKFVKEEAGENSIQYKQLCFYFACEGFRMQENNPKLRRLIKAISDNYLNDNIMKVSPELRNTISQIIARKIPPNPNVFDELHKNIVGIIAQKIHPAFVQSEVFIQFINQNSQEITKPITNQASTSSNINISSNSNTTTNTDGASSFSGLTVGLSPLIASSNLQTLHEDTELTISNEPTATTDRSMPLTTQNLLASQKLRLDVRPQGAHGYTYRVPFNSSFNPVSRQDSERQSCSSASLTDSDVNSKDGKSHLHRRLTSAEDYAACFNGLVKSQMTPIKSLAQGLKGPVIQPIPKSKIEQASRSLNTVLLCEKLIALKEAQDKSEQVEKFNRSLNDKLNSAQPREFPPVEDSMYVDDQSILDQHVSRVFSPQFSPGTMSPRHLQRYQHRPNEMSTSMPDFVPQSMRHSKSIPEHASSTSFNTTTKKLSHKWPSTNIDSGISLCSGVLPYKKEVKSIEQLNDESMRKTRDDSRRARKQMSSTLQISGQHSNFMPTSSSHHTNSLPRTHHDYMKSMSASTNEEYTFAVYTFGDEKIPYRTKIPGKRLTLKHFKEYLPKKGNFRFFFTTVCDDPDNPVIQEEVINDTDVLPLYEGKIMGTLKPE